MEDLSDLAKGSLGTKAGSMAATNTISVPPAYGAPGGESEASSSVKPYGIVPEIDPVGPVSGDGEGQADRREVHATDAGLNLVPPAWIGTKGQNDR